MKLNEWWWVRIAGASGNGWSSMGNLRSEGDPAAFSRLDKAILRAMTWSGPPTYSSCVVDRYGRVVACYENGRETQRWIDEVKAWNKIVEKRWQRN